MAYESDSSTVSTALTEASSPALSTNVINTILATVGGDNNVVIETLTVSSDSTVTVPAGTEIGFITLSDTVHESITFSNPPPVLVLQTAAGVDVLVDTNAGTGAPANYVIIGSAGNDRIVVSGSGDTNIVLGTGDSTVVGGTGDDTVDASLGSSTINGGGGHDTIVIHGLGASDFTISHAANAASAAAGASGSAPQASTTGHVILTNSLTNDTIDFTGIQYVQLDNNDAIIIAASTVEAGVAALYHEAFGRTGEAGGVDFWFHQAKAGVSLHDIATGFTQSQEFSPYAAMSDADFVTTLYANAFGRAPDQGGMDFWLQQLSHGATRADLLTEFASVAAQNVEGTIHTEATLIGTVIIVGDII